MCQEETSSVEVLMKFQTMKDGSNGDKVFDLCSESYGTRPIV